MKKAVVTYVFGDRDKLLDIEYKQKDWDYFCFTDNENIKSKDWNVIVVDSSNQDELNSKRLSNYIKYNPFSVLSSSVEVMYDFCITIDANITPSADLTKMCSFLTHFNYDATFAKHPVRESVDEEMKAILQNKKDTKESVNYTEEFFTDNGFNEIFRSRAGLFQTGIIIWKNTHYTREFQNRFWETYLNLSERDQLCLPFCLWQTKPFEQFSFISTTWDDFMEYFNYYKHNDEVA